MARNELLLDTTWYYYKVIILCLLILIDIIFNSFTQFYTFENRSTALKYGVNCWSDNKDIGYALISLQIVFHILMIFTLLSIFSQTFLFMHGVLGRICSQFLWTFLIIFLYPIVFLIERFVRVAFWMNNSTDTGNTIVDIWTTWYYLLLYVLKYVCAFMFYIFSLNSAFELGKSKYYRSNMDFIVPS